MCTNWLAIKVRSSPGNRSQRTETDSQSEVHVLFCPAAIATLTDCCKTVPDCQAKGTAARVTCLVPTAKAAAAFVLPEFIAK